MTLEETICFKMLDEYATSRHRCFLAEMNLDPDKALRTVFSPYGSKQGLTEPIRLSASLHRSAWGRRTDAAKAHNRNAGQGTSNPAAIVVGAIAINTNNPAMLQPRWRAGHTQPRV